MSLAESALAGSKITSGITGATVVAGRTGVNVKGGNSMGDDIKKRLIGLSVQYRYETGICAAIIIGVGGEDDSGTRYVDILTFWPSGRIGTIPNIPYVEFVQDIPITGGYVCLPGLDERIKEQ